MREIRQAGSKTATKDQASLAQVLDQISQVIGEINALSVQIQDLQSQLKAAERQQTPLPAAAVYQAMGAMLHQAFEIKVDKAKVASTACEQQLKTAKDQMEKAAKDIMEAQEIAREIWAQSLVTPTTSLPVVPGTTSQSPSEPLSDGERRREEGGRGRGSV